MSILEFKNLPHYSDELPIVERRDDIVAAIKAHQVLVIAGETGSGKTTQLPKMCVEAGYGNEGKIGCTQPRRIAAMSVSRRIAEELSARWGDEVGCKIRFVDETKRSTVIKVMTDGILLAETRGDPLLKAYEVLIIDEAHERSLTIDFLLGYVKQILPKRPDLKVIITSATIDTELFSTTFGGAPIIEVSGRLHPVEIRYSPLEIEGEDEQLSYVDAAVDTASMMLNESNDGDVLVFMPSERDIRETRDRLQGLYASSIEILPLMGSLSMQEQERVFRTSSDKRKVVVATNIAETSLTIPNIRYVIDTGLVRMSRYNARTRTKGLPIERISKSSANQRSGRAGRVRAGVCVRLYSEEEFDLRSEFSDPEILRANLAEVILRMKASSLGDIEEFPFLNPPEARAVRSGYLLLQELGALTSQNQLTPIGKDLSSLPLDPTIGRMLLQSRKENCLNEVAVIAAGLSIKDPRERNFDKKQKADEVHKKFIHPDSDFLTLLNIWNAFHQAGETVRSHGQLKKFCKANLLSFMRMREWEEIHSELVASLDRSRNHPMKSQFRDEPLKSHEIKRFDGNYRAIHRSILSGLLSQIAYKKERNTYQASSGRTLSLFPDTSLFERRKGVAADEEQKSRRNKQKAQWIMAGEIIETSRLYVRTVGLIVPQWIEELGDHLIKRAVEQPFWNERNGTVDAKERVSINGMILSFRSIAYSRVNFDHAKEIFIRHVLLTEQYASQFSFIEKNRSLLEKTAVKLAHEGKLIYQTLEENLVDFYVKVIPATSLSELRRFMTELVRSEPTVVEASVEDILGDHALPIENSTLFPDTVTIAGRQVAISYRYAPGSAKDGVTLSIPIGLAAELPPRMLDGAVPALWKQQVSALLSNLPKEFRSKIGHSSAAAKIIVESPEFLSLPLIEGVQRLLSVEFDLTVPSELLRMENLPDHLRPRVEVTSGEEVVAAARDLKSIQTELQYQSTPSAADSPWAAVKEKWERDSILTWDFDELPESIEVTRVASTPVFAYPALVAEGENVALKLFDDRDEAIQVCLAGHSLLLRKRLANEIHDLEKQACAINVVKPLLHLYSTVNEIKEGVVKIATEHLLEHEVTYPLTKSNFDEVFKDSKSRLPGLMQNVIQLTSTVLELRKQLIGLRYAYPGMREDLEVLLPPNFLSITPFRYLEHLPRYLKALIKRSERATNDPGRDKTKSASLKPYLKLALELRRRDPYHPFPWMVEELKVSVFAQELGTASPISVARLDKAMQEIVGK